MQRAELHTISPRRDIVPSRELIELVSLKYCDIDLILQI